MCYHLLENCQLCPRRCRVNRLEGHRGYCKAPAYPRVYNYFPHKGEEPPISGDRGSGIVFFSHCPLKCVYCQNYKFSHEGNGRNTNIQELSEIYLHLQSLGCHNINLVTGTHFIPWVIDSLKMARGEGLNIPVVWNTSGFEEPNILRFLEEYIDIYLTDFRYIEPQISRLYSNCEDYPYWALASLEEMLRQKNRLRFCGSLLKEGVIVRLLVLPGRVGDLEKTLSLIHKNFGFNNLGISVLIQYHPFYRAGDFPQINRVLEDEEIERVYEILDRFPIERGWVQEDRGAGRFWGENFKIKPNAENS